MATPGLYAVRFREKFYAYYNDCDSDRLGETVALRILDREQYEIWLATMRQDYAELDERLEAIFTISAAEAGKHPRLLHQISGADDLYSCHDYSRWWRRQVVMWWHIVLLDQMLSIDGMCHFWMDEVPADIPLFLEPANRHWWGPPSDAVHACIATTPAPIPKPNSQQTVAAYKLLAPRPIQASAALDCAGQNLVATMHGAHVRFCAAYKSARDASSPSDVEFREICYALPSMSSCSPDRLQILRLVDHFKTAGTWHTTNTVFSVLEATTGQKMAHPSSAASGSPESCSGARRPSGATRWRICSCS
ncbi:uncharacterized protein PV07_08725 [Cladophialophora immunda]|uniref:Uncharacterized protein n=1 Tax=Cladophialophora immunda TaxID=569365 RepID=A0A0D2C2Z1_9EURO|nr:uncharacterized protein PV07_08725 [Cladophialophora immunda]KIW25558.1 hypothetical protein PV07_08725 [Cladophialophora immunda]OQV11239.1 hypothetical protein CLAIMM_15101 [Cladophialophora immunda]